jgi:hypothetical protein
MLLQAEDIMAVFFAYDSEEEDQAVAPTINTDQGHASTYAFGTAVAPPTGGFNFLGGEATTCPLTFTAPAHRFIIINSLDIE